MHEIEDRQGQFAAFVVIARLLFQLAVNVGKFHPQRALFHRELGLFERAVKVDVHQAVQSALNLAPQLGQDPPSIGLHLSNVSDSLDWLERLIWAKVCATRQVATIEDIGYSKGYTFALTHWRDVLDGLAALREHRGMTVILIAHARIERFENPETEAYDRYVPRLHKTATALVSEWCDEVLFATYRVFTKATDEGFNQKRVKGLGSGERVLRATERPSHLAKNRLNLPDELPLAWSEFAKHLTASNAIAAASTTVPSTNR